MIKDNPRLFDEVVNLVDNPNILLCNFDKKIFIYSKRNFNS